MSIRLRHWLIAWVGGERNKSESFESICELLSGHT